MDDHIDRCKCAQSKPLEAGSVLTIGTKRRVEGTKFSKQDDFFKLTLATIFKKIVASVSFKTKMNKIALLGQATTP